jgi:hypothetical protein
MRASLNDKAPALLLMLASAILVVAFTVPIGAERRARTQYQRLEGFVGTFKQSGPQVSLSTQSAGGGETWGLVAQAVRQKYTPIEANALLSRVESLSRKSARDERPRTGPAKAAAARRLAAPVAVVASTAAAKAEPQRLSVAPEPAPETFDMVADRYENEPAKYSLEASAADGPVTLRLRGMSRSSNRFILKVAVTNRGGEDFFVRDFTVRDGPDVIGSKSFIRLFVEPGRTREGFVVFEKPRAGAAVHVALKEDREKGRTVGMSVPYPF